MKLKSKLSPFLRTFSLLTISALIISSPVIATREDTAERIRTFAELNKAIQKTQQQLESNLENPDILYALAELMFQGGRYDEAKQYLNQALEVKPSHLESMLSLSRLYRRQYKFEEGENLLAKAAALEPEDKSVKLAQARFAIDKMDFETAEALYQDLIQKNPDSAEVLFGMADLSFWLNQFDESEKFIKKCLASDPEFACAYHLYSRIHRIRQANEEWKETARKAAELNPFDAEARVALAYLLRSEGKLQESNQEAKTALKIDPYSVSAHSFLGRGGSATDYEEQELKGEEKMVKKIKRLLSLGDEYLLHRKFSEAERAFTEVLNLDPSNIAALIGQGTLHYHQENPEEALGWFFKVLDINPDYGLAHYGLSRALMRKKDRYNIKFAEIEKKFALKDIPEPPYLREIFINYDQVDPELQKIIRLSVAPLSNYLKALKIAGATFYLLPFHKLLWQSPHHTHMKGKRTFDLRLWDDIKGLGGFHAIGGADWERDVKYVRFNVVTHEFTHQVHPFLSKEQRKKLRRLFIKAKKARITLDYYADFNEWEYLAVGVEAYVSEEKMADQKDTAAHTRQELLAKDPDLYHFIENLNRQESYQENEVKAYIQKGETLLSEGKIPEAIEVYKDALNLYGGQPELLNAMGNAHRLQGEYDQALKIHEQAIQEFPDDESVCIGLADDYFYIKRDHLKAINLLENMIVNQPDSFELLAELGLHYYYAGDINKMGEYLQRAIAINPSPDPYSPLEPYYLLSRGLLAKEDYPQAEKHLTFSLEKLNRNNPQAWAELALIFLKTDREKDGERHLNLALKLNQNLPLANEIQAIFLIYQGKKNEAQTVLEKILEHYPERVESITLLAELVKEADPGRAEKLLTDGLKIVSEKKPVEFVYKDRNYQPRGLFEMPSVSKLHTSYASFLEKEGRLEESLKYHQEALKLFKYNYESAVSLVKIFKLRGNEEEAWKAFESLKNANPPQKYVEQVKKFLMEFDSF